jgi:predicted transcriptional regulator
VKQENRGLPPQVTGLAQREREIATFIYEEGACTAKDIEPRISPPISNGALRSMLVRLVNKGILRREWGKRGRGQQFVYVPSIMPDDVKRRAIRQLSDLYFEGSLLTMMMELFDSLDHQDEIAAARTKILMVGAADQPGDGLNLAA